MRAPKRIRRGIISLALGVTVYFAVDIWLQTRTWNPIYMSVDLAPGHVRTREFILNMNGFYRIKIEAKTQQKIPRDTVDCLLGTALHESSCSQASVIRADWVLTSDGKIVAQGASYEKYCCGSFYSNGRIGREIGSFHGGKGHQYGLDVNFLEDGSALTAADPHLNIEEGGDFSETGGLLLFVLLVPCGVLSIYGLYILASSAIRHRRSKLSLAH